MKKHLALLLALSLVFFCAACGSGSGGATSLVSDALTGNTQQEEKKETPSTEQTVQKAKEASTNEVTDNRNAQTASEAVSTEAAFTEDDFTSKGYLYKNMFDDSMYFVIVENHSQATVEVYGNATALNAAGSPLSVDDMSIDVLGPGEVSIGYFYFSNVEEEIAQVNYTLSFDTAWYYKAALADLSVEQALNDGNVTLTVTNHGDCSAQFVEAYALFLDANNQVLGYSSTYVTDNDSEIKPGATLYAQLDCNSTYDHVEVYLTGRSNGSSTSQASGVDSSLFEIREYSRVTMFDDTEYFLVVKNNSDQTVGFSANGVAYDAGGAMIGAADMSIDVIGPGQESIGYFYFSDVTGIASVAYVPQYDTEPSYDDVLAGLEFQTVLNTSNVIVTVTNNGTQAAEFVEAHVLFFDDAGNVTGYSSTYVTDDDCELKVGATLSSQVSANAGYDHVEVYLTARSDYVWNW